MHSENYLLILNSEILISVRSIWLACCLHMVLICYLAALLIVDHGSLADVGYILFGQASTCQFSSLIWYVVDLKSIIFCRAAISTQRQELARHWKILNYLFPSVLKKTHFFHICTDLRQQHKMHNQPAWYLKVMSANHLYASQLHIC